MSPIILDLEELNVRILRRADKLLSVDDKIYALNGHLVILLGRICIWRWRFAHEAVGTQNQLHVKIDSYKN